MFIQSYRNLLLSLLAMISSIQLAVALPASYYASSSLLSSGKWVKVKVSSTGMQELTYDRLRQLGFSDPSKVAVYGYPGVELSSNEFSTSMPDDLPAVPVAAYGDKLVFYGVASESPEEYVVNLDTSQFKVQLSRNLNNNYSCYFLTDTRPRLDVEVSDAEVNSGKDVVETAHGIVWHNFTDRKPFGLGAYLFGENIAELGGTMTYMVSLPGYLPGSADSPSMTYGVAVKAATSRVKFSVPGAPVRTVLFQGYGNDPGHLAFRYYGGTSHFGGMSKTADDMYELTVDPSTSGAPLTEAALDYYAFSYPRTTAVSPLRQDRLSFKLLEKGQRVRLIDASSSMKVWDVSSISSPREMAVKIVGENGELGFVSDRIVRMTRDTGGMQVLVFDPSSELCQVEVVGEVTPQDYHGMAVPQMLVVASDNTYEQAIELAALHREKTGVDVAVVPFREICNEFASGLPHPMAIRRLAKMLYDKNPSKFEALLIFGRAFNDNTGLTSTESAEAFEAAYVPMHQCDDPSGCGEQPKAYATDAIYAMLSDSFVYDYAVELGHFLRAPLDIKVGRIPAANAGEASAYLQKARKYLDNQTDKPIYNRAIMTADIGDQNLHVSQATKMRDLLAEIAPSTMLDMHLQAVYNPNGGSNENMRRRLRQQLLRGVGMWFYLGHTLGTTIIGSNQLWSNAYDRELVNDVPPFVVYGTCQTLVLDFPGASLQSDMLLNPTGGMIAGVGSTRPVYAQDNAYVCYMMARGYYSQKPGATFGDVYRDGKNIYVNTPETIYPGLTGHNRVAVNTMCYNFAGDPMMPLHLPQDKIRIISFNSGNVGDDINVNPLEKQHLQGVILDAAGNVDESFSGELTMTVYDGKRTVNTASTADSDNPVVDIDLDEDILQEVKFAVENGRFDGEFAFAVPAYSGKGNRVNLYAVTDDLAKSATGYLSGLSIGQQVPDGVASQAPVITEMYASDPEASSNVCLPGDFNLYATVESGDTPLLGSSDRMGGSVSLILDNSRKLTGVDGYLAVSSDGSASLSYPVAGLSDGPHELTLKVVNIGGESTSRTISVNVANVAMATTVAASSMARDEAVIDIDHQLTDQPEGRLVITDAAGKTVFSKADARFPYVWDLTGHDGTPVADGAYSASVYFKAGRRHGFATPARIVVGR